MRYLEGLGDDKQALDWLDREVAKLFAELVTLKALRNDRVIACRIPDELIIEIAKRAQQADTESNEWIRLSHICGRWRRVVVETPLLWTCIQANNVERATAFLHRSHNASVNVTLSCRLPADQQLVFTDLINSQAHRVQSLSLCLPSTDLVTISALLNSTLPQLRSLRLKDPRQQTLHGSYTPDRIFFHPKRPSDPPLHTLVLESVSLSWDLPILRDLRVLEISRLRSPRTEQTTAPQWLRISQLLDILESCPNLERLKVSTIGPAYSTFRVDPQTPVSRVVPLRHLRELEVLNSPGIIALLLAHLSAPHTTKVQVKASISRAFGINPSLEYVSPFPITCASNLDCVSTVEKLVLDFQWHQNLVFIQGEVPLAAQTKSERGQTNSEEWEPMITVQIKWDTIQGATSAAKKQVEESVCADIGQIFSPYVRELVVRGSTSLVRAPAWSTLFIRFPHLTSVSVYLDGSDSGYKGVQELVGGLAMNLECLACPQLRELRVWGVDLCEGGLGDVYRGLAIRAQSGGKLDSL